MSREFEIAKTLRESGQWDLALCQELCSLAGLSDEWDQADGEHFEDVMDKAADILGVVIY